MSNTIRFTALKSLVSYMNDKDVIITTFPFNYKDKKFYVILTKYKENDKRPSKYAIVKLEFYNPLNMKSLFAFADWYEVRFENVNDFKNFFGIQVGDGTATMREIFLSFSEHFSNFIPGSIPEQNQEQKTILSNRLDPENKNSIFLYNIKTSGIKSDGQRKKRTIENSNKAQYLRPKIYDKYKSDPYLSFYFSDNPNYEKTDTEIISLLAKRV